MKIGKLKIQGGQKAGRESRGGFSPKKVLQTIAAAKVETPASLPNQSPDFVLESTNERRRENPATFGERGIKISGRAF